MPYRPGVGYPGPVDRTTDAWAEWLGGRGTTPAPLDAFLARRRADRALHEALGRAAAWAAATASACGVRELGGPALLDALRGLDPADVVARRGVEGLRRRLRDDPSWEARCLAHGVPAGWAPSLARRAARWGEARTLSWLAAQARRPPLWCRARRPEAALRLRDEGYAVRVDGTALRVEGAKGIATSAAYRDGWIEVQDLASQRAGALALPRPGQVAWDACAGRGGKTVQLADALGGRGAVHATDTDPAKLRDLRTRVKRAGHAGVVRVHAWDGRALPEFGPEARRGFHVVLVDAPCTSSGTWRRNPDARLRTDPEEVPRVADLQRDLLALAARAVRPGGRVVYVTCSWLVEEDEDVAEAVLGAARSTVHGPPDLDADTLFVASSG